MCFKHFGNLNIGRISPGSMVANCYLYVFAGSNDKGAVHQIERHDGSDFEIVKIQKSKLLYGYNFLTF